jgi:hypothetical protein
MVAVFIGQKKSKNGFQGLNLFKGFALWGIPIFLKDIDAEIVR